MNIQALTEASNWLRLNNIEIPTIKTVTELSAISERIKVTLERRQELTPDAVEFLQAYVNALAYIMMMAAAQENSKHLSSHMFDDFREP